MKTTSNAIRIGLLILCFLAGAVLSSCPGRTITVLSYNVGNLFDGADDGTEYREYDPGRGTWNESCFRLKLARIALAVRRSVPGGPNIVMLQEIENRNVLLRLRDDGLGDQGYRYAACYPSPGGATTVGILSRFPLSRVAAYQLAPWKRETLRPVLEAAADADGTAVHLFCVHLKSKNNGKDKDTEKPRLEAAGIIARRVREIAAAEPGAAVVVAGDFNERADEYARAKRAYQTALVRLDDHAPASFAEASLLLCGSPASSGVRDGAVIFFDPWLAAPGTPPGSYWYKRHWEDIDHALFLPGSSGLVYVSFRAVSEPDMLHPRTRAPLAWDRKKPNQGFSDHLPILLTLEK
ncbi:MAG: endonuclease/exonuclease/phosphatase family protein [Spirochaetales bacterium]|nr:endonuclease/exonuclease/phosphatase family protein [Spirochaetales bacterium]